MAKKEKLPSTPESRAAKLVRKADKRAIFGKTFQIAFGIMLSLLLVYSVCSVAFTNKDIVVEGVVSNNTSSNSNSGNNSSINSSNDSSSNNSNDNSTDTNGGDTVQGGNDASASTEAPKELSASSSNEDVVNYFNTAINKVKPSAKQVTLNAETNSQTEGISGSIPSFFSGLVDKAIQGNMGNKVLADLDPNLVNATTVDDKNNMFPVEFQTWSSKLTADDIESKEIKDNGSTYTIVIKVKADDASTETGAGYGHNGKVFSVITPNIILENAEKYKLSSLIKSCETGTRNGSVTVTVDKATGNVTSAIYYFDWTLSVTIIGGLNVSVAFGINKDFTIAW